MMRKIKQSKLESNGNISLWLGNIGSELELDDYTNLSRQFDDDFGFEIERDCDSGGEYAVEDEEQDIRHLLTGFFRSSKFVEDAVDAANALGWTKAKTALVYHHLKYNSELISPEANTPLTFIGTFRYRD